MQSYCRWACVSGWKSRIRNASGVGRELREKLDKYVFIIWFPEKFNSQNDDGESSDLKSQCPKLHMHSDPLSSVSILDSLPHTWSFSLSHTHKLVCDPLGQVDLAESAEIPNRRSVPSFRDSHFSWLPGWLPAELCGEGLAPRVLLSLSELYGACACALPAALGHV